ncbi:UNVERIFIED_CONTAM: hypothetical protein Slati_2398900 [Sesamum latifolium]|uniref:Reverse transcriptase domain-containing protein n=1 Tax=Sesamum latifolium TaxID=2727402 RepID=A0AAW2WBR9_9LAMI
MVLGGESGWLGVRQRLELKSCWWNRNLSTVELLAKRSTPSDFNAVIDESEISGYAADTSASMVDFLNCITMAELIHLPFTGANLTWHNCSDGDRSLWKRLDRMLVNGTWLVHWPQSIYISASPRTSDHSPLILQGHDRCGDTPIFRFDNFMLNYLDFLICLFGGGRRQTQVTLDHLQPYVKNTVTAPEAAQLISPVTRTEIKEAQFDINENSAPSPDGFSSGFFKSTWAVVGEDFCQAIMEFFAHGCLLKQVNATLITLILKVQLPTKVGDFRPISYCNVIYKVITMIMVKCMQLVLDKMIDNSQNAFVPGRSFGQCSTCTRITVGIQPKQAASAMHD